MTPEERAREAISDWPARDLLHPGVLEDLWRRIEWAILEEREACAKVAEAHKAAHMPDYPHYQDGDEIAAAIRARV